MGRLIREFGVITVTCCGEGCDELEVVREEM